MKYNIKDSPPDPLEFPRKSDQRGKEAFVADEAFPPEWYTPLTFLTADELLRRYADGERRFAHIDMDYVSLAASSLDGAIFE
jgi:hypothetical protein